MYFEQFYLGCLAHASYMLGSEGEAIVVDPQRDVDIYLKAAAEHDLKIKHIFETHLHADFVSGHKELAARSGAAIYIGAQAGAKFPHVDVDDGFEVRCGKIRISVLETPGHTPESVCLVVTDEENSAKPWAVLTGDTLFLGDVGRPDLSKQHTPQQLAGMMYESLHRKLLTLADDVLVYPAHGAGSLCGRNMRAERSSTIGTERLTNYALQISSKEEFVRQITTNLPARPDYFLQDAEINRQGASALSELPELPGLSPKEVKELLDQGGVALDIRSSDDFANAHIPGSLHVGLSGQFATWAGTMLGLAAHPVLVSDTPEQVAEAQIRLARVGIEAASGYLAGGIAGWRQAGYSLATLRQISVAELKNRMERDHLLVLDVRRDAEWTAGHIENALWWALDSFPRALPEFDKHAPIAVHCKSGYRSMIACSFLQRAGYSNVINVEGGLDAWQKSEMPVILDASVEQ
jgi:hydroxyacylglutathione hydrolase